MRTPITPGVMRAPTPQPNVSSAPTAAVAASAAPTAQGSTAPGVTQISSHKAPTSNKGLILAAVALAGLLLIGGAWALRGVFTPAATTAETIAADTIVPVTDATVPNANPPATPITEAGTSDADSYPGTDANTGTDTSVAETPVTNNSANEPANEPPSAPVTPDTANAANSNSRDNALPGRAGRAERVKDRLQARDEQDSQPASGGGHTFAVVTTGDPALMIPAQQMIEDKLSAAGLQSVGSKRADIVVRVRADIIGNQDISFYGQSATLTSAYLSVKPFGRGGRALGSGFREKIDYTPLNAEDKVEQALEEHMDRVVSNVKN
jgi:serine/threonine-protein kinase